MILIIYMVFLFCKILENVWKEVDIILNCINMKMILLSILLRMLIGLYEIKIIIIESNLNW